jgi:hypothetical protein
MLWRISTGVVISDNGEMEKRVKETGRVISISRLPCV